MFKPEIFPEAFIAYFHKLPNEIKVDWFRDGNMIIGRIEAGDKKFMTQGTSADDFIKMVNESLITAFNIPEDYFDIIKQTKTYNPPAHILEELKDKNVIQKSFGLNKDERSFKLA